jgi:hypothetical protein
MARIPYGQADDAGGNRNTQIDLFLDFCGIPLLLLRFYWPVR